MPFTRTGGSRARRVAAVLATIGAAGHIVGALGAHTPTTALLFIAMAAFCLPCAAHLWTADSGRALLLLAVGAAAMLMVHLGLVSAAHAAHHATGTAYAVPMEALTLIQIGAIGAAAWAGRHYLRAVPPPPAPHPTEEF